MAITKLRKVPAEEGMSGLDLTFSWGGHIYLTPSEVVEMCKLLQSLFPEHFGKKVTETDIEEIAREALK